MEKLSLMLEKVSDLKEKIGKEYKELKNGTIDLLVKSVNKKSEVKTFVLNYIKNPDNGTLIGFIDDDDIFEFYLKYKEDIDNLCKEAGFVDYIKDNYNTKEDFSSLYDIMVGGTKFAMVEVMTLLKDELFQNEKV